MLPTMMSLRYLRSSRNRPIAPETLWTQYRKSVRARSRCGHDGAVPVPDRRGSRAVLADLPGGVPSGHQHLLHDLEVNPVWARVSDAALADAQTLQVLPLVARAPCLRM
jgi:hypothetical protein